MSGKQVKLFLADGTAGGLLTAEITNWTGHIVSVPRSELGRLITREEATRTGAYILLGDDPDARSGLRCYIGEADVIGTRLREHASTRGKDFWDRVVVITSKDSNLTKAHGRYLEAKLITLTTESGRAELENSTAPDLPRLPEADQSDMDYFVGQLQIVLPVIGVNILRGRSAITQQTAEGTISSAVTSPIFHLAVARSGIAARAQQVDGEFMVLRGSTCASQVRENTGYAKSTAAAYAAYSNIRARLVAEGAIAKDGSVGQFTNDIVFSSPSTAGALITGRACNGRAAWTTDEGTSFGAWESRDINL